MNLKLEWNLKKFDELTVSELYEVLRLRSEVFVVEQRSVFLDADGKDYSCHHLLGKLEGKILAYSRIVPGGVSYPCPSIGRIVIGAEGRRSGLGRELMNVSIEKLEAMYGKDVITIGAQLYLEKFYESFGFVRTSLPYDEDGILHIEMTRNSAQTVEI